MGLFGWFKGKKVSIDVNRKPRQRTQKSFTPGANFQHYTTTFEQKLKIGESVTLFWPFAKGMRADDIIEIRPGCKCTAMINWDDTGVTAVFTNQEDKKKISKEGTTIVKTMRVYYNDGVGRVPAPRGGMVWAVHKFSEVLELVGTCKW